jgi:hypothetical protein
MDDQIPRELAWNIMHLATGLPFMAHRVAQLF